VVNPVNYIPRYGDAVWISLNPQTGHEQAGRRPALVISPESFNNKTGLAIFCPITNQIKGYPFEVIIPKGFPVSGAVLSDEVKNLDWRARNIEFVCALPGKTIAEVLMKLGKLLFG
jgi:mRNA interferase MazF